MNGIFLWGTGRENMAEKLEFSKLSGLPAPWPEELERRGPWQHAALEAEGPQSDCRLSEKRTAAPVIFVAGGCSSVMALAWHLSDLGYLPVWGSAICIRQWQGRGQLGRTWDSPPGNLYAALRLPGAATEFSGMMSLLIGYAIIRVLQELGIPGKLKWPNDVMVAGKKAGGILIQTRPGILVAGVGLNLASAPSADSLRAGHAVEATHLESGGNAFAPLTLWERLLDRGRVFLDDVLSGDVAAAIERVQAQMAFMGQAVRVDDHTGRSPYRATLMGLSPDGGLVLQADNQTKTIRSGSIAPIR